MLTPVSTLFFGIHQKGPPLVVFNLNLVVNHSRILSNFQFMMVDIVSYLSLDDTSRCFTEIPKTLVIVLIKSAFSVAILFYICILK